jgi:hypothetical protein
MIEIKKKYKELRLLLLGLFIVSCIMIYWGILFIIGEFNLMFAESFNLQCGKCVSDFACAPLDLFLKSMGFSFIFFIIYIWLYIYSLYSKLRENNK